MKGTLTLEGTIRSTVGVWVLGTMRFIYTQDDRENYSD